jgi:PAS domain S-box-containing protein
VESSDDAILSKTLEGIITSWNQGAERMFGYVAGEMIGQSVTRLMPPDRVDEEPGILQRLRRGERIESYETVRRRKDGSLFDVSLTVSPIRDASGKIIGASKIARDVTARKQAEAAVRASEVRFRQLADAMPQIVWTAHANGQNEYSNRRWYEFTGFPEGTASDENFLSILHPDDLQKCRDLWMQSVSTGQPYQIEYRFRNRAGEYRWHLGRALPARNAAGEIVRWYGSSTDIHEQKLTAEALREKHAVTEQLNNVARALATELDLNKIVQIITDAGTRAIRAQFGAFLQGTFTGENGPSANLDTFSGASREALEKFSQPHTKEILDKTFRGAGIIRLDDARQDPRFVTTTTGEDRPVRDLPVASYLAVPVVARSGEVLGGLFFGHGEPGVFKEHDEKIVVALASQAAAAMNTARLYLAEQQARGLAEEANQIKDDFLAALSHELRTPLTPVLAILSSISEDTSLPPGLAADLEIVRRNVELETRLIDDLLDLTRITRGKLELHREPVAIRQLIESAINTCLPDLRAKQFTVIRDLERPEQTVFVDSARITQVLWNLLKNSIKFTPEGGTITVRSRTIPDDDGGQITIAIEDSGMGIEPDRLEHVFDAFEQGGRKITQQFGGLGLGLAISKAIAEAHRGTVLGASEGPGRGSTFSLVLPLGSIEPTKSAAAPSRPLAGTAVTASESKDTHSRPLRILLVEDHADTAAIIVRLLSRSGHEVIHADTISDALRKAETEAGLDLVMSDLGLPDGSGLDLMRELSTKYGLRGVALTGFGMESDRAESTAAGFSHHLIKPVNIAALRAIIAEMTKKQ